MELQRVQRNENTISDLIAKTTENPNHFNLWFMLASKYEDRQDIVSAFEVWESVKEAEIGDQLLANYKVVELGAHINKNANDLEDYIVKNLDSEYAPIAFRNVVNIYRSAKDTVAELGTWRKYVNYMELKQLQSALFYNNYAWRMGELEQNLDLALTKIRAGIKLIATDDSINHAGYLDTEAEILWKMGRIDEAITVIDKAIALDSEDKYFQNQKTKFIGE